MYIALVNCYSNVVEKVCQINYDKDEIEEDLIVFTTGSLTNIYKDTYAIRIRENHNSVSPNFIYDLKKDIFYPPQPFDSWIMSDGCWQAPKPYPQDGNFYTWDEKNKDWKILDKV